MEIMLFWFLLISGTFILQIKAKTQSYSIDDCPTCVGATCPPELVVYNATEIKDFLTSPNYPENYPDNELCRWMIETIDPHYVVRIQIHDMHIRSDVICKDDFLFIQDGGGVYSVQLSTCCQERCLDDYITSTGSKMRISFKTDGYRTDVGFNLTYWAVLKNSTIVREPDLGPINYFLWTFFLLLIITVIITLTAIYIHSHVYYVQPDYEKTANLPIPIFVLNLDKKDTSGDVIDGSDEEDTIKMEKLKRREHVRKTRLDPGLFRDTHSLPGPSRKTSMNLIVQTG